MKNKLIKRLIPAAAAMLIVVFSSCGAVEPTAPRGLEAAEPNRENPNRISLSWLPVDGADIYYVYRSGSEKGEFTENGFSVTSAKVENNDGVEELRYLYVENFNEGEGGSYWYKVSAAPNENLALESGLSAAVEAKTYEGTWGTAKDLGPAEQLKLAADNSALYAVSADDAVSTPILVQKYAVDETDASDPPEKVWTSISSPGDSDGTVADPFSVFVNGGELYTVFNDQGAEPAGSVSMHYYHDSSTGDDAPSFAWEAVGAAGFNGAVVTGLTAAAVGFGGDIYSAFLNDVDLGENSPGSSGAIDSDADEGSLWKYTNTTQAWFPTDLSTDLPVDVSTVKLVSHNNSLYLGYEDIAGTSLYLRAYDGSTALQVGGQVSTSAVEDGNVAFVSGGGNLYAVYKVDGGSFEVEQQIDNIWVPLSITSGKPVTSASADYGTVAAHWFNNALHVFYLDGSGNGFVKYYDEDEGWKHAEKNGSAITDAGSDTITKVQLTSAGSTLYAGYVKGSNAYVRVLE